MTTEVILNLRKNLRLNNDSIHRNFYQNRFIDDLQEKKTKISEFLVILEDLTLLINQFQIC